MPITVDQIVEEARSLPREQIAELVDRLTLSLYEDTQVEDRLENRNSPPRR